MDYRVIQFVSEIHIPKHLGVAMGLGGDDCSRLVALLACRI
ncbi:MAG: hypothetical protein ABJO09_03450 [Hyphomicrobiales bacterium]